MFTIAILIGAYSYLIFALGLLGFFYKSVLVIFSLFFLFIVFLFRRKLSIDSNIKEKITVFLKQRTRFEKFLMLLLCVQALVNLIGALGPELGFDALWYHLTLPKIYLIQHRIVHIPGSLLYYSDMPKLTEMLYVAGLALGSEIFAKLIHFSFGILTLFALYKVSRKFLSPFFSLLVLVVFYSNLVVGWMSTTSYVDLARTFFEIMALWGFLNWFETKEKKWLIESSVMLGLAVSIKLLAIGSIIIFSFLIIFYSRHKFKDLLVYLSICLLISFPWYIFSLVHTGNPIYPFFSAVYRVHLSINLFNPFIHKSDSISVAYLLSLFAVFIHRKSDVKFKFLFFYSFLGLIIWFLTPKSDSGRFLLPYLPVMSILTVNVVKLSLDLRKNLRPIFFGLIIFFSIFSIGYRFAANVKYLPVIFGLESKNQFLTSNLNFSFGDFYDTDNYFKKNIKKGDKVLLYGFHNLYYINFPFVDSSYVKKGDMFNYIAIQQGGLPKRFKFWNIVYQNSKTHVTLYSAGRQKWVY